MLNISLILVDVVVVGCRFGWLVVVFVFCYNDSSPSIFSLTSSSFCVLISLVAILLPQS